jgi:uncharacterized membrane protein (DUF441 family)
MTATPLVQQIQPYFVTFVGVVMMALGLIVTAFAKKLVRQMAAQAAIVKDTHTLVNSQMGNVLQIGKISAQSLYEKEPSAQNLALLNQAEQALHDHLIKQRIVDAGEDA